MENFEQIVLLLVSGQGILLSVALLSGILKKNYSNVFLGLITSVITIEVLSIWGMRIAYHNSEHAFPFWLLGSYLIIPSALWCFIKANVNLHFVPNKRHIILFLPAIIEIGLEFFSFYTYNPSSINDQILDSSIWYYFTEILPLLAMIGVLFFFGREILVLYKLVHNQKLKKDTLYKFFRLCIFLIFFSLITLFWFLIAIINAQILWIFEICLLLFLFIFGYLGYFQPSFFNVPDLLRIKDEKYRKYNDNEELKRIKALFEKEKIYIQPKLSLRDVALQLNLPGRYVSWLINSYHHTSFNTHVNSYRVAEVIHRINDPKERNKTLLGIALESGFNSKSSFNSIFKANTGKNPSDFLKK